MKMPPKKQSQSKASYKPDRPHRRGACPWKDAFVAEFVMRNWQLGIGNRQSLRFAIRYSEFAWCHTMTLAEKLYSQNESI